MDELGDAHDFGVVCQTLPDPVLQSLHIVIGYRLDRFHLGGLKWAEVGQQAIELAQRGGRKSRDLDEMRLRSQRLEPFDLNLQAAPDQPVFGKLRPQCVKPSGVATVQRRKGGKVRIGHTRHPQGVFRVIAILPVCERCP